MRKEEYIVEPGLNHVIEISPCRRHIPLTLTTILNHHLPQHMFPIISSICLCIKTQRLGHLNHIFQPEAIKYLQVLAMRLLVNMEANNTTPSFIDIHDKSGEAIATDRMPLVKVRLVILFHTEHIEAESKWTPFCRQYLQMHFLNENVWISSTISQRFVSKGLINNILALVQIMAWHRLGDKPLYEPVIVRLLTHIFRHSASMS